MLTASQVTTTVLSVLALAGPFLAAAVLLVAAGAAKVRDPRSLVRALRSVGLRVPPWVVRAGAAAEVALGLAAAGGSRPAAAGVAVSYLLFTGFVLVALRRGGVLASCGCFGRADTPPTRVHASVTGALALVAAAVAVRPVGGLAEVLAGTPAVPLLAATAALTAVLYLALALLPLLQAGRPAVQR